MGDIHGCSTSILSFPVASFLLKVLISGNFSLTAGAFDQISSMLVRAKESQSVVQQNSLKPIVQKQHNGQSKGFYEVYSISKEVHVHNILTVSVGKCLEGDKIFVHLDTDLPEDVVVH